jgi:hypothetical protein
MTLHKRLLMTDKQHSKKSATAEDFMNGWFNVMGKLWEDAGAGKAEDLPGAIKDVQDDIKRVRAEMQNDKSKCAKKR